MFLCFFFCNYLLSVVITACTANSVRQVIFTAVGALYHAGHGQLPYVGASLVSACFRHFPLRYCHWNPPFVTLKRIISIHYTTIYPFYQVVFEIFPVLDPFLFFRCRYIPCRFFFHRYRTALDSHHCRDDKQAAPEQPPPEPPGQN